MLLRLFLLALLALLAATNTICRADIRDPFDIPALESEERLYRSIYIESGVSGADSSFWSAGGSIDINQYWRTDFTYDKARYQSVDNAVVTDNYQLAVLYELTDIFSLGLEYEFEDIDNQIEIYSIAIPIIASNNIISFAVTPVNREIRLYTNFILPKTQDDHFDIKSDGYRVDAAFDTSSHTRLSAGYESYDYDADVTQLASAPLAIFLLKPAALDRSSGFIDNSRFIGASLFLDTVELGLEFERTRSAVDSSNAEQITVSSRYSLNRQWDLELLLTHSETPLETADGASLSLHYNW